MIWGRLVNGKWCEEQMAEPFDLLLCEDCQIQLIPSRIFR